MSEPSTTSSGASRRWPPIFLWAIGIVVLLISLLSVGLMTFWLLNRLSPGIAPIPDSTTAVKADYSRADSVSIILSNPVVEQGIRLIQHEDGTTTPDSMDGLECHKLMERKPTYAYFAVDPSFKPGGQFDLVVEVEYFDASRGRLDLQYDGVSRRGDEGPYTRTARRIVLTGSRDWKTNLFSVPDARFKNRQNSGADFRVRADGPEFYVRRISLRRVTQPREGPYTHSNEVSVTLASNLVSHGLILGNDPDSAKVATKVASEECYRITPGSTGSAYLYVAIDPSFKAAHPGDCFVEVEYFSLSSCRFRIEYDGLRNGKVFEYEATETFIAPGGAWGKTSFLLSQTRFRNSQNDETDFRLNAFNNRLFIRKVTLRPATTQSQ